MGPFFRLMQGRTEDNLTPDRSGMWGENRHHNSGQLGSFYRLFKRHTPAVWNPVISTRSGFLLEFTPLQNGGGMTIFC